MDINEQIQFVRKQIDQSLFYRDEGLKNNDHEMAALNMSSHFMENLELGLLHWRLGQSPVEWMHQAVNGILQHRDILMKLGAKQEVINELPLYFSVYVASLLKVPHPSLDVNSYEQALMPGVFLGNVLIGADSIENWPQYQDKLPNKKRNTLARATFDMYAGLLAGKISAAEGVSRGEINYRRRRGDAYYEDSPVFFGGGDFNDRYVDFRLAAVLKHIGSTVPSLHAWRW